MRKMISFILALVTVGCTVSFGGDERPANRLAVVKSGDTFKVIYEGSGSSLVKVSISDADGNEVFSEKLASQSGFIRPYNFSLLPKGDYKICVTDRSGEYSESICFRNKEWAAHVAKVNTGDQKYMVAIPCKGNEAVAIHIYDQNDQLVYSEQSNLAEDFARIYNLKNLQGGATFHLVNHSTGVEKIVRVD